MHTITILGVTYTVLGTYANLSALYTSHPSGNNGDVYYANGNYYQWQTSLSHWVNVTSLITNTVNTNSPFVLSTGTTTTGAPGTQATSNISGTYPDYSLNLTIPAGTTGATGAVGPAGTPGVTPSPNYSGNVIAESPTSTFFPTTVTSGTEAIGTPYVAPSNGWLFVILDITGSPTGGTVTYSLDSGATTASQWNLNGSALPIITSEMIPVSAGDSITLGALSTVTGTITYGTQTEAIFVPYS